jgi:serine/threonine protein kinase
LAARNVLLNYNLHAKVADFGLAARMYMRNNFNEQIGANMDTFPFRCSAYEILRTGVAIKEKSDVWSFGVLMWEIFYLGEALPYVNIAGLPELVNFLETGQRLEKPPLCPQDLYELMLWCWNQHYQFRPTFSEIKRDLKKFKPSQQQLMINSEMNSDHELGHQENSDQTNPNQSHEIIVVSNPAYDLETIEQS